MLANWVEAGMSPDIFWDQNVSTFNAVMIGAAKRRNEAFADTVAGAWWGEFFAREKRVKPLKDYLPKPVLTDADRRAKKNAAAAELLSMMRRIKSRQEAGGISNMKIRKVKRNG